MESKLKTYIILHLMLLFMSTGGVFTKLAGRYPFLSLKFCLFYGAVILVLFVYAIGWQQIIKRMPLTLAYANRAVSVVWGLIWGFFFFGETITPGKLIGGAMVILGVVMYALEGSDGQ